MAGPTISNVSSMLRSAQSLQQKQIAYSDDVAAYEWQNSEQTIDDYNKYSDYLKAQTKKTSDPTKTLTYTKTINGAFQSYTSNEIQRSAIAVLEGGGSMVDKQNTVGTLYKQAVSNGDLNLATNLRQQYDNIDVEIQKQQVAAQQAYETLSKANSNAEGLDYKDSGVMLEKGLADLTAEYKQGGQQAFSKALKTFVQNNKSSFEALGVQIPTDSTTSIAQVTAGVIHAIGQYNTLAALATQVSDPSASSKYYQDAVDIATGAKTFSSPYGSHSLDDYVKIAANPNGYISVQNTDGQYTLKKSAIKGYTVVGGAIQEVPANTTILQNLTNANPNGTGIIKQKLDDQKKQLQKLGFSIVGTEGGQIQVQLTNKTADWLPTDKINKSNNEEFSLIPTDNGYQFTSVDSKGTNHLYTLGFDDKGLAGVLETQSTGQVVGIHGQYGFNNMGNTAVRGAAAGLVAPIHTGVPFKTAQQINAESGNKIPVFTQGPSLGQSMGQVALNVINSKSAKPQMVQRPGGGFNFIGGNGQPISAYTYAQQTGQKFRTVLQQAANQGDTFSQKALGYAGDDGAYNPATVPLDVAQNWNALTWGNTVKLQTPQAARAAGASTGPWVSTPSSASIPLFSGR